LRRVAAGHQNHIIGISTPSTLYRRLEHGVANASPAKTGMRDSIFDQTVGAREPRYIWQNMKRGYAQDSARLLRADDRGGRVLLNLVERFSRNHFGAERKRLVKT
jgi:hypothetical protein